LTNSIYNTIFFSTTLAVASTTNRGRFVRPSFDRSSIMSRNIVIRLQRVLVSSQAALGIGVYHDVLASGRFERSSACQ